MIFMKIRFTEWRDPPAPRSAAMLGAASELAAAQARLATLSEREAEVRADIAATDELLKMSNSEPLRERIAGHAAELDNLHAARKAALAAQRAAGEADMASRQSHPRVASNGYQIIDEIEMRVIKLVDEAGADLPVGAVYGYEIVDQNPVTPGWAAMFAATIKEA